MKNKPNLHPYVSATVSDVNLYPNQVLTIWAKSEYEFPPPTENRVQNIQLEIRMNGKELELFCDDPNVKLKSFEEWKPIV